MASAPINHSTSVLRSENSKIQINDNLHSKIVKKMAEYIHQGQQKDITYSTAFKCAVLSRAVAVAGTIVKVASSSFDLVQGICLIPGAVFEKLSNRVRKDSTHKHPAVNNFFSELSTILKNDLEDLVSLTIGIAKPKYALDKLTQAHKLRNNNSEKSVGTTNAISNEILTKKTHVTHSEVIQEPPSTPQTFESTNINAPAELPLLDTTFKELPPPPSIPHPTSSRPKIPSKLISDEDLALARKLGQTHPSEILGIPHIPTTSRNNEHKYFTISKKAVQQAASILPLMEFLNQQDNNTLRQKLSKQTWIRDHLSPPPAEDVALQQPPPFEQTQRLMALDLHLVPKSKQDLDQLEQDRQRLALLDLETHQKSKYLHRNKVYFATTRPREKSPWDDSKVPALSKATPADSKPTPASNPQNDEAPTQPQNMLTVGGKEERGENGDLILTDPPPFARTTNREKEERDKNGDLTLTNPPPFTRTTDGEKEERDKNGDLILTDTPPFTRETETESL